MKNRMKWLITGGCGFIGTNLVRALARDGADAIRVLDNLSVGSRAALADVAAFGEATPESAATAAEPVSLIVADVQDAEALRMAARGVDVIVHLAANAGVGPSVEDPRTDCLVNVLGTFNCLEAARANGVRRFVFASSGAPIGEIEPPIHEEVAPHPVSPYGASKLAGEGYCSAYWRTYGIETVALRFGNVYGPASTHKSSVVAKFLKDALSASTLEVYGDGTQTRDFIYIADLVDAIARAASAPDAAGETFQIAANTETTVSDLAERVRALLSRHGFGEIAIRHSAPRVGDVRRNYSDTRKARARLGWSPATTLDEGLERTAEYFLRQRRTGEL